MMKKTWILSLCLGALLSACGDDDGGGPIAFNDLPTRYESIFCDYLARCGDVATVTDCKEALDESALFADLAPYVTDGTVVYDAAAAGACMASVPTSCSRSAQEDEAAECDEIFAGTLAENAPCMVDEQCLSDWCDQSACTESCCEGVCGPASAGDTVIPLGGDCSGNNTVCAEGSFAKYDDTYTTCVCTAPIAVGQACGIMDECVAGNYCVGATWDADGVCGRLPAQGETCDPEGWYPCDLTTNYCDGTTLKCTPKLAVGATCDVEINDCVDYADCTGGICVAELGLGDTCTETGTSCFGDLSCLNAAGTDCAGTDTGCTCRFETVTPCP